MAIDIKFDLVGNPEPPTIILANRNGNKLGQLKVNTESIDLSDKFNDASEISFRVNKYIDGEIAPLWDKIVDFKLIYCKEWDVWFEIRVELDEETESVKTVFGTQLGYAELSQVMLYDIEINTEKDIERDDYKITILYDPEDSKASLLNRMFEKAPHYSIIYVDHTIANIQRSFGFDDTSIVDACQEVSKEIGCYFKFHSNSDENGMPQRTVSVYDLYQNCNDCHHRGEFTDVCPKCGSTNIDYNEDVFEDTLIFVTSDELASEGIQLVTDTDAVKNCFKLEAGDDLMTATVRNCNPNGTDYIWHFSDSLKEDMSDELIEKLESYDELYKHYYNDYVSDVDADHIEKYNNLVDKYSGYNEDLQKIVTPIKGYSSLMNAYYNVIDLDWYLKSGLMPSIEMSETNANEQASLLATSSLSPVAVGDASIASLATANNAVLGMAKTIVKSTYRVQIKESEYDKNTKTWVGNFSIVNYSDEDDTAVSNTVSVKINDDLESFVKQKINKELNKENTDDLSITGLFKKEGENFRQELKKYALVPLTNFRDACQSCLDIMIDQGIGNPNNNYELYSNLYLSYYNKLIDIEAEMKIREDEINIVSGKYNLSDILVGEGLQQKIEKHRDAIQKALNFQKYVGDELWLEFCTFRREDTYSNDNYISDGLDNAELFKRALEFYVAAENEIYKSAELQHSISSTLNNLLAIKKFEPLVKSFKVGNWLRVGIDEKIFKLRLLEYEIDFGDFDNIPVEFSDVTKIKNGITDVESILSQASSMATSYGAVLKQADKGSEARSTIREWLNEGLNSALVQIQNNVNEDIVIDKNGLLGRSYSEITESYSPEQIRLTHNIIAYTDNNWETVRQAIGKHQYKEYNIGTKNFEDKVGYGMSADFVTAGIVSGSQIVGGNIYSANYKSGESGTHLNLTEGDFDFAGGKIVYDSSDDTLTLRDVTIEWSNDNKPDMTINDITGLDEYLKELDEIKDQLDGRAQTWYQDTDPSINWTTDEDKALHVGDLWHYTGETANVNGVERMKNSEWVWQSVDGVYQWVAIEISDELFDVIDGKAQIFITTPTPPYNIGDLWVQGSSGDILHCTNSKLEGQSYNITDWSKSSKYTDNSRADEAYGLAGEAKTIGENLVSGLGFKKTQITGEYVISPVIAGGTLLIGDVAGTYAKIATDGTLSCTNANVSGHVEATSGTIGKWNIGTYGNKDGSLYSDTKITGSGDYRVWIHSADANDTWVYSIQKATNDGAGSYTPIFNVQTSGSIYTVGSITANSIELSGSIKLGDNFWVNADGSTYFSGGKTYINVNGGMVFPDNSSWIGIDGAAQFASGIVYIYGDGDAQFSKGDTRFASGKTQLLANGNVKFADGKFYVNGENGTASMSNGQIWTNQDGSAGFANGNFQIDYQGNVFIKSAQVHSAEKIKKNFIKPTISSARNILNKGEIWNYNLIHENDDDKKHFGFVIGDGYNTPDELIATSTIKRRDENGNETIEEKQAIDIYSMCSVLWECVKELTAEVEELKRIKE